MNQVKRAEVNDVEALGKLSDEVFRPNRPAGTSMPIEFSLMFSAQNARNLYFVEDAGRPVSLIGMMPGRVHVQGVAVSVVSMGSVCTLEDYRGRHLASQMIQQILADFSSTTSLLLVSGELSIYRRIGCVNFGVYYEAQFAWAREASVQAHRNGSENIEIRIGQPDASQMLELYQAEPFRFSRSRSAMETLLQSMQAPGFRAQSESPITAGAYRNGALVAYGIGQKRDRNDKATIFEWAGDRTAIPALALAIGEHLGAVNVQIAFQPADRVLQSVLSANGTTWSEVANQGTLLVLNPALLVAELQSFFEERYGSALRLEPVGENAWKVNWTSASAANLPDQGRVLTGGAELSTWFFHDSGLGLPLPRTDDLNYI